ncbi:substrate-binding domain-containing protein [Methylopila turkensis]|uniref:Methanol oxidation protein n=1 Tax=Methylopila turkensis TaxID=1437816 RepID=A0A9W6JS03_9HYPH|nr:substrate-binding domain-containing protein [Methylopila turkensis]GLK80704.1 methanol oxidation protein [Methylopila turkensis]
MISAFGRSVAAGVLAAGALIAAGASTAHAQTSDLVNRATLRVCADPADMPLSNEKGEGFENKIAELLGKELGIPVDYTWFPQATGFYRMTLGSKRCDVVMGYVAAGDPVLNTNPYFKSAWVLVTKKGGALDGVDTLSDERLKSGRIGVIAGTAPANHLARYGLLGRSRPYSLMVDRRYESPAEEMLKDIDSGAIDAGILWGPIGGYYAAQFGKDTHSVVPLVKDQGFPPLTYRITMGIRPNELNWKHRLNDFIAKNQNEINKILLSFNIPLLDEQNRPIVAPAD